MVNHPLSLDIRLRAFRAKTVFPASRPRPLLNLSSSMRMGFHSGMPWTPAMIPVSCVSRAAKMPESKFVNHFLFTNCSLFIVVRLQMVVGTLHSLITRIAVENYLSGGVLFFLFPFICIFDVGRAVAAGRSHPCSSLPSWIVVALNDNVFIRHCSCRFLCGFFVDAPGIGWLTCIAAPK